MTECINVDLNESLTLKFESFDQIENADSDDDFSDDSDNEPQVKMG